MRRRAIVVTSVAFVIAVVCPAWRAAGAHGAFRSGADNARRQATAPRSDGRLSLRVAPDFIDRRSLQLVRDAVELTSIRLPPEASDVSVADGLARAVWNPARTMVAVAFTRSRDTYVLAFLQRENGEYVVTDVSEVESRIIGGIGPFRVYVRRETIPLAWEDWSEGRRVLKARTSVWDQMGQRYRGIDVVLFSNDGVPLWR
jgi:hypothetical protein